MALINSHIDGLQVEWQFGNIEYSVPIAAAGTAPDEAVHTLTTHFQVRKRPVICDEQRDSALLSPSLPESGHQLSHASPLPLLVRSTTSFHHLQESS